VPSSSGSQELFDSWYQHFAGNPFLGSPMPELTAEETDRIADGEPYCFRCGKPASSFSEYRDMVHEAFPEVSAADYVRDEEGTYNPETNRFACDECYIAIGMPVGEPGNDYGWKAP
jgi:hypothetical protein